MLIIFDLDDTLIDTSGTVAPFKLRCCLKALPHLFNELMELYGKVGRSGQALRMLCERHAMDPEPFLKELIAPLPADFFIPTLPHAKKILSLLRVSHTLALVTWGYPPFQLEKLEKAGLDRSIFSKIVVSEDGKKKPIYEELQKIFTTLKEEVVVCGDRREVDLDPAEELGFKTIHVQGSLEQLKEFL